MILPSTVVVRAGNGRVASAIFRYIIDESFPRLGSYFVRSINNLFKWSTTDVDNFPRVTSVAFSNGCKLCVLLLIS